MDTNYENLSDFDRMKLAMPELDAIPISKEGGVPFKVVFDNYGLSHLSAD